jgi:1-deoxy-D-xylulose-5-phosphate reductoisomerase
MSKKIAILGSTGSIGQNALRVIQALGNDYTVTALTAHSKADMLAEQTRLFNPSYIAITNPDKAHKLQSSLPDYDGTILVGPEGLTQIAQLDQVDIVITAVVGAAGLNAAMAAAEKGKILAIANKEPLVVAGKLLTETAKKSGATILPIDSEHSAIFQILQTQNQNEVNKIILTASGGPFRQASPAEIENALPEDALAHPTWNMGPKITVDSATMMNKALEIIEAVWLFNVTTDKIDVLVHPESIVHSLVEFIDGSVIAQLGTPDMCLPIQYALTFPKRLKGIAAGLKLDEIRKLTFEKPDLKTFRALELGFQVAAQPGSTAAVFNAANEAAVRQFLEGKIKFGMIVELIEHCLNKHKPKADVTLDELMQVDAWARQQVREYLNKKVKYVV